MIKLIISDLDGTLALEDGSFSKETFEVIHALNKKNIKFAVATGRQGATVENDFKAVLDCIYVIADNGAMIKHQGHEIGVTYLDQQKARQVIETGKQIEGIQMIICCKDTAYNLSVDPHFEDEIAKYYYSLQNVDSSDDIKEDIIKIAFYHREGITKEIENVLKEKWGEHFAITVSGKNWVDIGSIQTSKGAGVRFLQQKYQIDPAECMAFGDYFNDVSMLNEVEESYVMEHAPVEMKQHAKHIAKTGKVLDIIRERCL
ncbi:Cof-type HAD-IIB family hydrolase [Niameybacter massiliensis]|uniref:Cof-type HAD-IIB family hydrolase n=1 Tax=Niameybacter massiliensis TaxID=1658108 RepID=UPI0006B66B1B|nr:Cof-type HAD-IIB family hydrolase [Niameybacter massiliensis]